MKLNKKGFAFSTMLYGTAALIAAVLYIILNITKSSSDETYYYGERILKDLNDCVTEEVALENCYNSGRNCDTTSYHACLGVSDDPSTKGVIIAEKLKERLGSSDGLIEDMYATKRYIYQGTIVKNYIEFSEKTWRILSIEPNGSLKLIDISSNLNLEWDSKNNSEWENSSLYNYLNGNYLVTINDKSKLYNGLWNKAYIYPPNSSSVKLNLLDLIEQELNRKDETRVYGNVGILSMSDYFKAGNSTMCENDVLSNNSCISWLSDYSGWVIDINASSQNTNNKAYYLNSSTHKVAEAVISSQKRVYPVIYLSSNSVIIGGDGSETNPYKIR